MGRTKKTLKAKEPIKLRSKVLANGNRSLYLDKYVEGEREYEYLKMYLVPELDDTSKFQNAATLKAANAIKAQRLLELTNGKAGIEDKSRQGKILLLDWLETVRERKAKYGNSGKRAAAFHSLIMHMRKHIGDRAVRLCDIDKPFLLGFIDYLSTAKRILTDTEATISKVSARQYYLTLGTALNEAAKSGVIPVSPVQKVSVEERKPIKPENGKSREYLTIEEVKRLQAVECPQNDTLRAFMFSCFTGLRFSDIKALTWGGIQEEDGHKEVVVSMVKTKKVVRVPLSDLALQWLPQKTAGAAGEAAVFRLPQETNVNERLKKLTLQAGITKHVTFHTARHTFATMGLTSGVDLYTISKLLGHTKITTTQIYAEIINQKKVGQSQVSSAKLLN